MTRCECGSYAINPGRVGRDDSDPHLCDVCYWRARAQRKPDAETIVLIKACRAAFAEELAAYDIDPPIHHVRQGHDDCDAWLSKHGIKDAP